MNISEITEGQEFTGAISNTKIKGKINIVGKEVFLCQNEYSAADRAENTYGYKHSYVLSESFSGTGKLHIPSYVEINLIPKTNTMTYKKGDKFSIKETEPLTLWVKNDREKYRDTMYGKDYFVRAVNKSSVQFDTDMDDPNPWVMSKKDFEEIAVFEAKQEEKPIVGYKLKESALEFKNAVEVLCGGMPITSTVEILVDSIAHKALVRADVLDKWFEPTYAPQFKVGDWVYVLDTENTKFFGNKAPGKVFKLDEGYNSSFSIAQLNYGSRYCPKDNKYATNYLITDFRLATPAEIESVSTRVLENIGSRNATLTIKDGIVSIRGKSEKLKISLIKEFYEKVMAANEMFALGGFSVSLVDGNARIYRIGCADEDNRVSLNEIKKVLDATK